MKIFAYIVRVVLGLLFVFSGIVKLIDPKGTAIKLEEYFTAFGKIGKVYIATWVEAVFQFLYSLSILFSIALSTLEVVLGVAILLWFKPKKSLWISIALLVFFGFLTGYSATCNPNNTAGVSCVTDCGCFGDFLKLKPIQSFYKDLIFFVLAISLLLWAYKQNFEQQITSKWMLIGILCSLIFGVYNTINEPIIDFRPYKIGNNILEKRQDGIPAKIGYVMKLNGKEKLLDTYPESKIYTFVRTQEIEIEKSASIHDFYLFDDQGNDETEKVLNQKNTFLLIKNLSDLSEKKLLEVKKIMFLEKGTIILSASPKKDFENLLHTTPKVYNLDETVLKTMARNYPSVLEIDHGIVILKTSLAYYLKEKNR